MNIVTPKAHLLYDTEGKANLPSSLVYLLKNPSYYH